MILAGKAKLFIDGKEFKGLVSITKKLSFFNKVKLRLSYFWNYIIHGKYRFSCTLNNMNRLVYNRIMDYRIMDYLKRERRNNV